MDWLKPLYPEAKEIVKNAIPDYWPGLVKVLNEKLDGPMISEAVLPLASCKAVNGNPENALYILAALLVLAHGLRILDDLYDRDRHEQLWEQIGPERAFNCASVMHNLSLKILSRAPFSPDKLCKLNQVFIDSYFIISGGQDRDLAAMTGTVEDYLLTIEMKTGCAFALACASGAMAGTDNPEWIEGCHFFGHHLGIAIQILGDMDSIWDPAGLTDLQQGKITLPLIYAMNQEHPGREELMALVKNGEVATSALRIKQILDSLETKNFMIWAALKERSAALEALEPCPDSEGKEALRAYITGIFGDLDSSPTSS